ncbi:DUF4412 domain-containing protein [Shivajiella indica]|uniref:DUF4412 domain-containing protein n=1 Tax=Shivajiella indica TaxID=872115 RepID=A0ABW5BB79_9BACT
MKRLKDAAERGVSRAVEKRVETEMEKLAQRQLEKVFRDVYGPSGMPGVDINKVLEGISQDVAISDSYEFTGYSVIEITGIDDKGKTVEPTMMRSFLSDDALVIGMEIENEETKKEEMKTVLIYDLERNASIILMDSKGEKSRMAYGIDLAKIEESVENDSISEGYEVSFRKTGNTKTILGYNCEEFETEDEDGKALYWVTDHPIKGRNTFWGESNPILAARMQSQKNINFKDLPKGNMMELNYVSKKDKSNLWMKVIELNDDSEQKFIMSDYPNVFAGMQEK